MKARTQLDQCSDPTLGLDPARCGAQNPPGQFEKGRLARTIGSQKSHDLAWFDRHVNAVQRPEISRGCCLPSCPPGKQGPLEGFVTPPAPLYTVGLANTIEQDLTRFHTASTIVSRIRENTQVPRKKTPRPTSRAVRAVCISGIFPPKARFRYTSTRLAKGFNRSTVIRVG